MPDRDKILSNQMRVGELVFLRGHKMTIDLIMFNMSDFDIILRMDFLSRYGVEIGYRKKKVRFHLDNGEKFTFGKGCVLSIMISSVKARKMLGKGCTRYMAHVVNKVDK